MKRLMLFTISSVSLLSILIPISFGRPPGTTSALNAQFINWPKMERVIHAIGWIGTPLPPWEGGTVATLGRGSPIIFGFEMADDMQDLWDYKNNPNNDMCLKIDGVVVADNLWLYWQDPFLAQPGVGPKWIWDHDGDGLGDGNGNGVDDWDGPIMFWRFGVRPALSLGDHVWELWITEEGVGTWLFSDGTLRIIE